MEKKWTNQYIALIKSKPGIIYCSENSELAAAEKELLKSHIQRYKKIFCEIGSGSGEHLLQTAGKNPADLYIGLELRFKRIFRTAEKAETSGIKNIIIARHNAQKIDEIFMPNSLDGIFLNFPDPWSRKRRWEKHSLLNEGFLRKLEKLLGKNGFFSYKTDHQERFLQVCDNLKNMPEFRVCRQSNDLLSSEYYSENVSSEFERLFVKKSMPIYYLYSEKV